MRHDRPFTLQRHAYVDGELDDATRRAFETHLAQCAHCRDEIIILRSLKRAVAGLAHTMTLPAGLAWPAGGCLAAAIVAGLVMVQTASVNALVADHARWLADGQGPAIASAEPVALRSWLSVRVEVPPPVLARAGGCRAVGARIGTLGHRRASTVIYRCGTHVVDFYAVPDALRGVASAAVAPHPIVAGAVNVVGWKRGRLDCYAVSDLAKSQLVDLAQYIQDHALEG